MEYIAVVLTMPVADRQVADRQVPDRQVADMLKDKNYSVNNSRAEYHHVLYPCSPPQYWMCALFTKCIDFAIKTSTKNTSIIHCQTECMDSRFGKSLGKKSRKNSIFFVKCVLRQSAITGSHFHISQITAVYSCILGYIYIQNVDTWWNMQSHICFSKWSYVFPKCRFGAES